MGLVHHDYCRGCVDEEFLWVHDQRPPRSEYTTDEVVIHLYKMFRYNGDTFTPHLQQHFPRIRALLTGKTIFQVYLESSDAKSCFEALKSAYDARYGKSR